MTTQPATSELTEAQTKDFIKATDLILERAMDMIIEEMGTPLVVVLDRLTTRAAALSCIAYGKHHTSRQFRACAQRVEEGAFDNLSGEGAVRN